MRCPDCNKFVSYDADEEPEVSDSTEMLDEGAIAEVSVRIVNTCAECGTELKSAQIELSLEFDAEEVAKHRTEQVEHMLGEVSYDFERTERVEGKGRSARTFYGVRCNATVECSCGWTQTVEASDDVQASHMDDET